MVNWGTTYKSEVSDEGSLTLTSHSWSQGLQLESYLLTWVMLGIFVCGELGQSVQEWGKRHGISNINLSHLISGFATWVICVNMRHVGDFLCVVNWGTHYKSEVSDVGSSELTSHSWSQGLKLESYLLAWVVLRIFVYGEVGHTVQEWEKQRGIININLSQLISEFANWVIFVNLSQHLWTKQSIATFTYLERYEHTLKKEL